jgi:hypothetical protein
MWLFEGMFQQQALLLAQVIIESVLVVLVALLWWRQRGPRQGASQAGEGAMAATENLLRRLEEKRRSLEGALESVRAKEELVAPHRPTEPAVRVAGPAKRGGLERAPALAAKGLSSAEISRQLGVPRGEVEMYLSLRGPLAEGGGRQP